MNLWESASRLSEIRFRSNANRAGKARVSVALCRSLFSQAPLILPGSIRHGQHGGHYKLMQLSARCKRPNPLDHANSHSHAVLHACAFVRPLGYGGGGCSEGGGWMDADEGCELPRLILF
ncbi:hypothetical protein PBY51_014092 [Eleginops maclovinus]|uniref:Uncharacterized protein n=1 Tax=Eleginops maclovinus TaxID=56733 RepID=A0AAN7WW00_ELEMC|nr:hypothetical protein PBY51_014092 [Eleginops maclovinus]